MVSLRCVAPGISQTLMVIEIWRQVWTQSGKAQDTFASWLIDRRCLREAEAFSWDAGAKTSSMAFLDLNRGTTNGACFSVFNVLSLVHYFSCLDVEWDIFWFGYNHPSEVCWVTPSLATVSVYLLKLGFGSGVQPRCHFALFFVFLLGLGLLRFLGNLHSLLFYYYYFLLQRSIRFESLKRSGYSLMAMGTGCWKLSTVWWFCNLLLSFWIMWGYEDMWRGLTPSLV